MQQHSNAKHIESNNDDFFFPLTHVIDENIMEIAQKKGWTKKKNII